MLAGDSHSAEIVKPILDSLAREVVVIGEDGSQGTCGRSALETISKIVSDTDL